MTNDWDAFGDSFDTGIRTEPLAAGGQDFTSTSTGADFA